LTSLAYSLAESGILDIGTVLVVGMVEQYFVQASPIKDFAAF
jgi:hypothetical protein